MISEEILKRIERQVPYMNAVGANAALYLIDEIRDMKKDIKQYRQKLSTCQSKLKSKKCRK